MATHCCIWCLTKKDEESFNVEHVLPQSFGTFEGNFTLVHVVTGDCTRDHVVDASLTREVLISAAHAACRRALRRRSRHRAGIELNIEAQPLQYPSAGLFG